MTSGILTQTFAEKPAPSGGNAVAVMMSGGVDSSVAALCLREAGFDVFGVTMRIPRLAADGGKRPCCGVDAAFVCRDLNIPHYFMEVDTVFDAFVIEPFKKAYFSGATPSPCVDCNTHVKFEWAWDVIREQLGVPHLATGHYANIAETGGTYHLTRGADRARDQSYFLYGLRRERLAFLHLPLGRISKPEVRQRAVAYGLSVSRKPDSMELCFANEGDYRVLFQGAVPPPGPIMDTEGRVMGRHEGLHRYTIGQRRGLGIAHPVPLYVLKIHVESNVLVVGPREAAMEHDVSAASLNLLLPGRLVVGQTLYGKIRSVGEPEPCTVVAWDGERLSVRFDAPVFAPASGQHLVLYDGDSVVAGGVIVP